MASAQASVAFSRQLGLPPGDAADLADAADAVREEYRRSNRWQKLFSREVTRVEEAKERLLYKVVVSGELDFEWSWEGSTAFRPPSIESFDPAGEAPEGAVWRGEVVELDESESAIYVAIDDPEHLPTKGYFFVRPFPFLEQLQQIYRRPELSRLREDLPSMLRATGGAIHPPVAGKSRGGIAELENLWARAWGLLWGPPGTGKTTMVSRQVASCMDAGDERILVVSTTNRATDEVAIGIARELRKASPSRRLTPDLIRLGRGSHFHSYREAGCPEVLDGSESTWLRKIADLREEVESTRKPELRARINAEIKDLQRELKTASSDAVSSPLRRTVVTTAFHAIGLLLHQSVSDLVATGRAPFSTVIIDEAGLLSRATIAVLGLLGARRIVLAGDPKQLAPISRIARVLPPGVARWMGESGLTHLRAADRREGVHLLETQYRMHPEIRKVVSSYQYGGCLRDGAKVLERPDPTVALVAKGPRAIWYVLDEETDDVSKLRADRGPGQKSWVRELSLTATLRVLGADPGFRDLKGLYLSPFVAQAKAMAAAFVEKGFSRWRSGTIHSHQGVQAPVVVFDTVNAGSTAWPANEWRRLVNVGLSRAEHLAILVATRKEMQQTYLAPLIQELAPRVLRVSSEKPHWQSVSAAKTFPIPSEVLDDPSRLGPQLRQRKSLFPVMSQEQERLCNLQLDGKARLVRGVAGSGKTVVLAHWLAKTLTRTGERARSKVWVVYANRSLQPMIARTVQEAWEGAGNEGEFPEERVIFHHMGELLDELHGRRGTVQSQFAWDLDAAARDFLSKNDERSLGPRCDALFIDEAQDFGPDALRLLRALVRPTDPADPQSRQMMIFYDNAQNLYGRPMPRWKDLGIDLRGRSTIMKESFRSTRPISEFALNALYRLEPPQVSDTEHAELLRQHLIEPVGPQGEGRWWKVRFCQAEGPAPTVHEFPDRDAEMKAIASRIAAWVRDEGVKPNDIAVLFPNSTIQARLEAVVSPLLKERGISIVFERSQDFTKDEGTVIASTPHSFKGYDAEVVLIAGADRFEAKGSGPLASSLYVALTRARSLLAVYGIRRSPGSRGEPLMKALKSCAEDQLRRDSMAAGRLGFDDLAEMRSKFREDQIPWLLDVLKAHGASVSRDILTAPDGEILAEPCLWFAVGQQKYAILGADKPSELVRFKLEDRGVVVLVPGDPVPGA